MHPFVLLLLLGRTNAGMSDMRDGSGSVPHPEQLTVDFGGQNGRVQQRPRSVGRKSPTRFQHFVQCREHLVCIKKINVKIMSDRNC